MTRTLLLVTAAWLAAPACAQELDPDRKKNAHALFSEGLRAETEKPVNLLLAIKKYDKALAKAKDEKNNDVAAAALVRKAWCNEKLEPENVADAQTAYGEVVSSFGDAKPWGDIAKERASYKGIDVWLRQLHASLDAWRVTPDRSPLAMAEKKKMAFDKIQPLDKEAVPGLVWGLAHADEVIRDFSADTLAELVDDAGIASVIGKLNDASPQVRAGAGSALQKIYKKWNDAAELDRRASELERDRTSVTLRDDSKAKGHHEKLGEEAKKLQARAGEIRKNIPATINTAEIQGALEKIIGDENAHPQARREAAQAAAWIGRISGPLVEAILKGMDSKDHNVREACVRAAGAVDTNISTDKHKLADRLIKCVQEEPAKAENRDSADWANDEAVRQAAAEALEHIALVKTLPALIEALDDNDARVRHAAHRALREITRKDFDYEPDKPLKDRKEAQAKWEQWWKDTQGVVVLVERFWGFQSQWKEFSAVKLFDPPAFTKEVESRRWTTADPKIDEDRAKRVIEDFQRRKNVFVQDAEDLGAPALEQLARFIGGETDREAGKPNAATRYFVAESFAKIVEKHNVADGAEKLTAILNTGDTPAKKTGAAIALGFLPKDKVGEGGRQALQMRGLAAADPETRAASAYSLGKVGEESSGADLTKTAQDADVNVQIASLRALSLLHPKNPQTVATLGEMVADEPAQIGGQSKKSVNATVREHAVDALGAIGDPASVPFLLRARRDTMRPVREAATIAIQKVYKADAKATTEAALAVVKDEKHKTEDRSGAALLLGDTGEAGLAKTLSDQIIDLNPPRVLREPDAGVRIRICEGIGNLKAKSKVACDRLFQVMSDDYEKEAVRDAAYRALCTIFEVDPDKEGSADKDKQFKASNPKPARDAALEKWRALAQGPGLSE